MEVLYLLIPLAVILVGVAIAFFVYTVKSGQYDDLEGPGHRILMDDDDPRIPEYRPKQRSKDLPKNR
ncbi:MAG: cbb3-type cytochrome oxidase assembly protein CcoS [Thiotrichales bacterium]